jgi:hypothetical protein
MTRDLITGEEEMEKKELITYCGLYFGLCSQLNRVPQQARALQRVIRRCWPMRSG